MIQTQTIHCRERRGAGSAVQVAMLLALGGLACSPVQALDRVLGPGECNEAGFVSALDEVHSAGGGSIRFECGAAPVTIPLGNYRQIGSQIEIDGGGLITFDANHSAGFFQIFASARLELRNLTLTRGTQAAIQPLENFGELLLDNVTVSNCTATALENMGTAQVRNSRFIGNRAPSGGGAAIHVASGSVLVERTEFVDNRVNDGNSPGLGGAIRVQSPTAQALVVLDSLFTDNQAFDGGAIYLGNGTSGARIEDSQFHQNIAGYGGALRNTGVNTGVRRSVFTGNRANVGDGGAIWSLDGTLFVFDSDFEDNRATTTGGAISCYGNLLNVFGSSFALNQSQGHGGAIYSTCSLLAANSTFHQNAATGDGRGGGAIYQNGPPSAFVYYLTLSQNSAAYGGGIASDGAGNSEVQAFGSLLVGNTGGNCGGVFSTFGYNLSDDTNCAGALSGVGDLHELSLALQPYGNYGGLTNTRPPQPGNPAIDHIPDAACQTLLYPFDQRGAARPENGACDSGAVELGAVPGRIFVSGFEGM